jgi:hypothetical protein
MMQVLFRNRFAALGWVGLSLLGAAAFVSDGGGRDQLDRTAAQIREQRAQAAQPVPAHVIAPPEAEPQDDSLDEAGVIDPDPEAEPTTFQDADGKRYRVLSPAEAARLKDADEGQ